MWQLIKSVAVIAKCDKKISQSVTGITKSDKKLLESVTDSTKCAVNLDLKPVNLEVITTKIVVQKLSIILSQAISGIVNSQRLEFKVLPSQPLLMLVNYSYMWDHYFPKTEFVCSIPLL